METVNVAFFVPLSPSVRVTSLIDTIGPASSFLIVPMPLDFAMLTTLLEM